MNTNHYKQFNYWERLNLNNLIENKPTIEITYGPTPKGWSIIKYRFLINISLYARKLKRSRKTIRNELIRGALQIPSEIDCDQFKIFTYSIDRSCHYHINSVLNRKQQSIKIYKFPKLKEFVQSNIGVQSLKGIGGRSLIEFKLGNIECPITAKTLYNYIDNPKIDFIDRLSLKRSRKQYYRTRNNGKRINGISIMQRPEYIDNRSEFGHWEMDIVEGIKSTSSCLLTLCERVSRKGLAILIPNKKSETINKTLLNLQKSGILIYGRNIKSITTDNGSEFWKPEIFRKSIYGRRNNIDVYFCSPYHSYEKGSIENFNLQLRYYFPKKTDFSRFTQGQINEYVYKINSLYRSIHNYSNSNEIYNENYQN